MRVLVACEESQAVCKEFRALGHEAYSCDLKPCSGGRPEWHIQGDVLGYLNDGWDLIIAHPPCTYLSHVAVRHHSLRCSALEKINARTLQRIDAMRFFMEFAKADCEHIAIENPVGVMNTCYRKPDQIIEPYMFSGGEGDKDNYVTKRTCLWLKGLPLLVHADIERPNNAELFGRFPSGKARTWEDTYSRDSTVRSKTFQGIAHAMALQWSEYLQKSRGGEQVKEVEE